MKAITNINQLHCRDFSGVFHISSAYDVLFRLMESQDEQSPDPEEDPDEEVAGNVGEFDTDDFSSSTSTELKTTSTSNSDELKASSTSDDNKASSGSATSSHGEETSQIHEDDCKPSPASSSSEQEEKEEGKSSTRRDDLDASLNLALQHQESFPCTLFRMLNTETGGAVKWLGTGDGFEVTDQNVLEKEILPKYFPSSCLFQSFVRKLYRWGFLQVGKRKCGHYIFSNESFHRDNELYKQLKAIPRPRKNTKSAGGKPQEKSSVHTGGTLQAGAAPVGASQSATAQSNAASQLNSILSSYGNNPAMLHSLQSSVSNMNNQNTFSTSQTQPNAASFQQMPSLPNQALNPQAQNTNYGNQSQGTVGNAPVGNVVQHLAGDVTSQLNSLISSYSNNPAMLSSLQSTMSSLMNNPINFGTPQNQPNQNAGSFQPLPSLPNQALHPQAQNTIGTQPPVGHAIVENVRRFLSQGQQQQQPYAASFQAQPNPPPMLQHRTEPLGPINAPYNQYGTSQITDTTATGTGTTTDTSASSQGQNDNTEQNKDRKRRRSPSPP